MVTMTAYCDEIRITTALYSIAFLPVHIYGIVKISVLYKCFKTAPKTTSFDVYKNIYVAQNNLLLHPRLKK